MILSCEVETVAKAYSGDLRRRVIDAVEAGASRHEAAEDHGVSASSAIKWMRRWRDSGTSTPKPRGGSSSPLDQHSEWILSLIVEQPDLILEEIVTALRKRRIQGSRSALGRFFARHDITVKKKSASSRATPGGRGSGAPQVDPRTRPA
jgi:transposase